MKFNYEKLGNLIELSETKNKDLAVTNLVGMNINKEFMPSVANTVGTNLANYKVIQRNQFAYNNMQVGRDRTIRVARYDDLNLSIISPAYKIFQIIDTNKLNSEFLMLYFLRSEFDRLCWFYTDSSIRGSLDWHQFCDIDVPVPPIEIQTKIVKIYNFLNERIKLKEKINKNLDDILDSIFKENFIKEFDNDNNDWKIKNIGELPLIITDYVANGSFASLKENVTILDYEEYAYFIRNTDLKSKSFQKFVNKHSYDFLKKSSLFGNEVIISNVGDVGSVFLCPFLDKPMTLGNNMILVKSRDDAINLNFYLFLLFRSNYGQYLISTITAGSVQSKFNKTEFKSLELTMPNDELIIKFNNLVSPIFDYKNKISDEIVRLTKLRDTLLPKLMSGEIDVSKINCDLE